MINAVGNLGGFLGPSLVGFIKDATGSFSLGLLAISMGALVGAIVLWVLGHDRRLEQVPEMQARLHSA
jgi:MFS transporter, ACS family, tartrate transporter